jgi:hypothetical protein
MFPKTAGGSRQEIQGPDLRKDQVPGCLIEYNTGKYSARQQSKNGTADQDQEAA